MSKHAVVDPPFASARVLVISDFNCPYCFALNEWLTDLGAAQRIRWVGIEHLPELGAANRHPADDRATLAAEVADVTRRAPNLRIHTPDARVNSHFSLLLQNALEDDAPELAPRVRRDLFLAFWRGGRIPTNESMLAEFLAPYGIEMPYLDPDQLVDLHAWWTSQLDRIPAMIASTRVCHFGLQDKDTVRRFVDSALRESSPGPGCQ